MGRNKAEGHFILEKRVDVKSADDYQGKNQDQTSNVNVAGSSHHHNNLLTMAGGQTIQKPNPYVNVELKGNNDRIAATGDDLGEKVKFTYPKSKIFVGGLDFKLTSEELREHFNQFGEVQDAIILKDIYTG